MLWGMYFHTVSLVFLLLSSLVSIGVSLASLNFGLSYVIEWEIFSLSSSSVVVTLVCDWVSTLFLGVVLFISSMVMYYSGDYMDGDKGYNRFMYMVFAFVFSMGALIISPNLISILLGWDGLGLISYVLVIYYQNEKSANAGMLTILSNRIGDVGILLSISLLFMLGGWNFIFYGETLGEDFFLLKIFVCLAAMTKSAQIPFSAWLPAAMAAPTPVSALVHSSTLVTAGVYILIRFSGALEGSSVQTFLLIISCLTMFMAGLGANFEFDLKKIIALSTLSQLGVMMGILALGFPDLAFFHLLTHALFKALLFMCAGSVIHSVKEYQDIRNMGSLVLCMPLTSVCMNLANLALCGMPFLAGFYSKDLILEVVFMSSVDFLGVFLYILSTGLTVCYTFRLVYYSLSCPPNMSSMMMISEGHSKMMGGITVLSVGAVSGGSILAWVVFPESYMICLSFFLKVLALLVSVVGGLLGYIINMVGMSSSLKSMGLYWYIAFMGSMWFMPILSTLSLSNWGLRTGDSFLKVGDKGWSEYFGGEGSFSEFMTCSKYLQLSQENMVMVYMKGVFLWVVVVFLIFA
uniref:NADH-ubiquinone oxidoreductase chain 5 n=1 Tax=Cherax destructor TaxID=6723 RepID=Q6TXR5_CHEDE|nr:NADH dehydrogenase subunit 5 [Cherax destructor]AAR37040.1 NADH dehydrogenase subunit 5 [Cherax destructor]